MKYLVLVLCAEVLTLHAATYELSRIIPPAPAREFRAAWVATVANIDWPSRKDLTTEEQKAELVAIMDRAVQLKLNAIVFQVRPACDAIYASEIEPWSEYLTGTMGRAPEPFYDPLAFAIEEAHKRGLELHAWFNPYRAGHSSSKSAVARNHICKTQPQLVKEYGKQLWLDPGEKAVQDYSLRVVMDVVRRYDVDGVHFDDYFYPYKEKDDAGKELEFPDEASWRRYGVASRMLRDDWRRENVNTLIQRVYSSIKATKPWVQFGISPFGIWRPGVPSSIDSQAYDAYAKLYADSRKWLRNGWIDYFAPQLYWGIKPDEHSFPVLLKWWAQQNIKSRNLYAGLDTTKTAPRRRDGEGTSRQSWPSDEILNQIQITRKQAGVSGHIHWDMKSLNRNPALGETLSRVTYAEPALTPAAPWLATAPPAKPMLSSIESEKKVKVQWSCDNSEKFAVWLLQLRKDGKWSTEILAKNITNHVLGLERPEAISLRGVDRFGNLSPAVVLAVKEAQTATKPATTPKTKSRKLVAPKHST